jgi:AcrR family transcriptional regulator
MSTTKSQLVDDRGATVGHGTTVGTARERILAAAYELFAHRGIQAVGIDAIVERSGVARQTLYRHFASKQELVLAFLELREEQWTKGWLQGEVERRASGPEERLLAIFDVFDGWFHSAGFEGCSFINVMLESADPADPVHRASVSYLAAIRHFLQDLARKARIADPDGFSHKWHILMKGSIVSAGEGDQDAARRAREMASLVLRAEDRLKTRP